MILRLLSQWPVCLLAVCFAFLSGMSFTEIATRSRLTTLMEKVRARTDFMQMVFCAGTLTGVLVSVAWFQAMATPQPLNIRRMNINPLAVEVIHSRYTYDFRDSHGVLSHGVKFCRPLDLRKSYIINGWAVLPSGDCLSLDCQDCWIDILGDKDLPLEITQIGEKHE